MLQKSQNTYTGTVESVIHPYVENRGQQADRLFDHVQEATKPQRAASASIQFLSSHQSVEVLRHNHPETRR
jgi:hypothetical protein